MANSFSLLRLPNEERLQVLRCMDGRSLLLLSLVSRKTKGLVKSVQIKPSYFFHVSVSHIICFQLDSLNLKFYLKPEDNMRILEKPNKVWITADEIEDGRHQSNMMELQNPLEIREWYQHILYILSLRQPKEIGFYNEWERFDLEAIKTTFRKIDNLAFHSSEPRDDAKAVLNTFLPDVEQLRIMWSPYPQGDTRLQKLLIQNFDSLTLGLLRSFERLTLEDLLICNARYIKLSTAETFERVNRFLKLWIKGANPRLRKLIIEQRTHFNAEDILKGIRIIREIPREEDIVYEGDFDRRFAFRTRAVDIMRYDGTIGTVIMIGRTFSFLVWE